MAFLEETCHWQWAMRFQSHEPFLVCFLSCPTGVQDEISQLADAATAHVSAQPSWTLTQEPKAHINFLFPKLP